MPGPSVQIEYDAKTEEVRIRGRINEVRQALNQFQSLQPTAGGPEPEPQPAQPPNTRAPMSAETKRKLSLAGKRRHKEQAKAMTAAG